MQAALKINNQRRNNKKNDADNKDGDRPRLIRMEAEEEDKEDD